MIRCRLRVLMAERKLSIQDLSTLSGLSRTTVSALFNEKGTGIQYNTMNALCEVLSVTPGEIFYYEEVGDLFI